MNLAQILRIDTENAGNPVSFARINLDGPGNRCRFAHIGKGTVRGSVLRQIDTIGRTFIDKAKNHGGGVKGFPGALKQKKTGNTQVSGEIFEDMQIFVIAMLNGNRADDFKLDHDYMPNGKYADKVAKVRLALKDAGFDPNGLGIY